MGTEAINAFVFYNGDDLEPTNQADIRGIVFSTDEEAARQKFKTMAAGVSDESKCRQVTLDWVMPYVGTLGNISALT